MKSKTNDPLNTQSLIQFQETSRDFRTEIPNIIFTLLETKKISNNAFILYCVYRRIAGEHGGCWIGTRALAEKCQLSTPTITKCKKQLSQHFDELNGKSLIKISRGDPKKEEADTVTIIDIWPENHALFKKSLTCVKRRHDPVQKEDTGVCKNKLHKKEPYKKELSKNPPLSSPREKEPIPKKSLRSEEEEIPIYKILEDTILSPKEKSRLTRDYTEPEVVRAIEISKTQTIKKTLMGLLINILENPDKWDDASNSQLQTPQQRIAHEYNEELRRSKKHATEPLMKPGAKSRETRNCSVLAKENDVTMKDNYMKIVLDGFITQVSIKSEDFVNDINKAINQLW